MFAGHANAGGHFGARQLQEAILRANDLSVKLKVIQERAGQVGIALPAVSPQEEAAMARSGASPNSDAWGAVHRAWDASLGVLVQLAGVLVFLWWLLLPLGAAGGVLIYRRRASPPVNAE